MIRAAILMALAFAGALTAATPRAQAQSGVPDGPRISALELRDTTVGEAVRLISELSGANVLATGDAGRSRVTMIVRETTVRGAISSIARVTGLAFTYDPETRAYLVLTNEQFANDIVISRDGDTRIFTLRHQNVVVAAQVIANLFGSRVSLNLNTDDPDALVIPDDDIQQSRSAGGRSVRFERSGGGGGPGGRATARDDDRELTEPERRRLSNLSLLGDDLEFNQIVQELGLEPTIFITISRDHNLIYVRTADQQALESIEAIIRATDRPTKQVLLEMKIVSLELGDAFNSIFNFGLNGDNRKTNSSVGDRVTTGRDGADLGASNLLGGSLFFQFLSRNLLAQIELLERQNRAKTIATPLLAASNNSPAELFVGQEAVLTRGVNTQTSAGTTGATVTIITTETEIRDVGQTVEIIPRINADRTVTLVVRQENSTIVENGGEIPTFTSDGASGVVAIDTVNTARLAGTVTARDGATIAIGGLFQDTEARSQDQIPVFGEIPIFGRAGSSDQDSTSRSELVLLITPHVYSTADQGQRIARARLAANSFNDDVDRDAFDASDDLTPDASEPRQQQSYVALTRYAAARANGYYESAKDQFAGVIEAEIGSAAPMIFGASGVVVAEPVAAYRKSGLYATTVLVENTADTVATLDPSQLKGDWVAITLETDILAPRGQVGSRSFVYLLSTRPFEQALFGDILRGEL